MENLVDLSMAVWERGGCIEGECAWIIEASVFRSEEVVYEPVTEVDSIDNVVGY